MDFLHRNANNQPQAVRPGNSGQSPAAGSADRGKKSASEPGWMRATSLILLSSLTILVVAICLLFYFGKPNESNYIDSSKQQAVFLTNGQVYFGKIAKVTNNYVDLQDIYYLNSQQQPEQTDKKVEENQQTTFSLVKLGCELHGPADQMIINRDQVSFWENLKSDGKVAKAIEQWRSQNPNGQNCNESSTNTTQQSSTDAQNAAEAQQ